MKQLLLIIVLFSFIGCKKSNPTSKLNGLYTETIPVSGRSQLNFVNEKKLVRSEPGSSYSSTYSYSFGEGRIYLQPDFFGDYPIQAFDFEIIDDKTFRIENLYPSIPTGVKTFMTFQKQ